MSKRRTEREGGEDRPWHELPPSIADLIEPELGAVTDEIMDAIARQVPEYARPLEGSFGRGVERGVDSALRQFIALIRDPATDQQATDQVYVELGRGEYRQGRDLDSLQAAYRVGARTAWRRLAAAAEEADVPSSELALLAEAIFAYIDRISARSVAGYADARSEAAGERGRARRRLLARLLAGQSPAQPELAELARSAGWQEPRTIAALACPAADAGAISSRLGEQALGAEVDGVGCVAVSDPLGPGRAAELESACATVRAALGPAVEPARLAESWDLARSALALPPATPAETPERADGRLAEILLRRESALAERIAELRLAPFAELTPRSRAALEATALAYLVECGNAAACARRLGIHPQTARYRLARISELIGDALDDPETGFEIELCLRARELAARAASDG
ncbi:helix-turn-helix domain-containing protein [Thermoleophilia bacterium SCSIO 60948]|nr:helix-turn-helix domain-containing protein [Thermoleophilia bacterium SCSIO 60948]